jgi:hypothetical protein
MNMHSHLEYLMYTKTLSFDQFFIYFLLPICMFVHNVIVKQSNSQQNEIFYHFNIIMSLTPLYVYYIY